MLGQIGQKRVWKELLVAEIAEKDPGHCRGYVAHLMEPQATKVAISLVILFNAVSIGVETDLSVEQGLTRAVELICTSLFTLELGLRLYAEHLWFLLDAWNDFG